MPDLALAFSALRGKQAAYSTLWNYYDGDHPLIYSTQRLKQVFANIDARFSENWAAVVVDAALDRVNLRNLDVTDNDQATETLGDLWQETGLDLDEEDVHRAALVCGEAFVIAWREENDDGDIQAYYNDPRSVHVVYDAANPRRKRFAAKWWNDEDGKLRITLYYPDHLEYYVSRKKSADVTSSDTGWKSLEPLPDYESGWPENPYGIVPVFHFRNERRIVKSALKNAIEPQNAINKLLADMMVAAEFGAFKQRWVIANADADLTSVKNAPYESLSLPASDGVGQDTQVGEFSETDLNNYIQAMEREAATIAIITRTPKHYFFAQGGDPSGEALIAMEAPLNKKAARFIKLQTPVWRRLAQFLLTLSDMEGEALDVRPIFDPPETVQPRTQAEIREINYRAGIPLATSLRWEGRTQAEIDEIAQEAQAQSSVGEQVLKAFESQLGGGPA